MSSPEDSAAPELLGRVFGGQFRLVRMLGSGGMGDVYLAEQLEIGRRVVLKLLRSAQWSRPDAEERFKREAQALAQLNHPNIVHLYTFGRSEDDIAYLAMEYIEGKNLASLLLERGALPEWLVLEILDQLASALGSAHRRGIVHRDLKPENVMLVEPAERPLVKVLDFGIAKLTADRAMRITRSGELLGTPLYMAPEQLRNHAIDERTDLYGLGVIAYELITGQVPFLAETTLGLLGMVVNAEAVPPRRKAPERSISPALEALILRCMAKDPDQRFQSAEALREALRAIPAQAVPPSAAEDTGAGLQLEVFDPPVQRRGRGRGLGWAAASLVGLALLLALGWLWRERGARQTDPALPAVVDTGDLTLQEWVQGIPFPQGTRYDRFEPEHIEAHIAAQPDRVLAFYRTHLAAKWGGAQLLANGLFFPSADALIARIHVSPTSSGTQLSITRRITERLQQ